MAEQSRTEPATASAARAAVGTESTTGARSTATERASAASAEASGATGLATVRGSTTIADSVVTKVAGIAAREVPGVYELGGGTARAVGTVVQRVGIGDARTQGVSVEVGERQAAVDLTVVVEYGESIPHVSQHIRDQVIKRIEGLVGLEVTEVNISVDDLHFPGDDVPEAEGARVS